MAARPDSASGSLGDNSDSDIDLPEVLSEQQKASNRRRCQDAKFGSWYELKRKSDFNTDTDSIQVLDESRGDR